MTKNEALRIVSLNIGRQCLSMQEALKVLVPEVRESEDERIRKELKEAFEAYDIESKWNGIPIRSIFAWLEKQKEPENVSATTMIPSCWVEEPSLRKEQKPDSITKYVYSKDDKRFIQDCANILVANDYSASAERLLSMFEQKPAEWKLPNDFEEAVYKVANFISPFDSQGELRRVSHRFAEQLMSLAKKELVEKPAEWGEEDEKMRLEAIRVLESGCERYRKESGCLPSWHNVINWLKDLHPQPKQEWSEEDEMMINSLLEWLNPDKGGTKYSSYAQLAEWREWLKSLRPSWKPSEEQMEALNKARRFIPYNCDVIAQLYEDLKKLK